MPGPNQIHLMIDGRRLMFFVPDQQKTRSELAADVAKSKAKKVADKENARALRQAILRETNRRVMLAEELGEHPYEKTVITIHRALLVCGSCRLRPGNPP